MATKSKLLTSAEAAHRVGLSTSSIRRLARANQFPKPVKVSTRVFGWSEKEIARFMQKCIERRHNAV